MTRKFQIRTYTHNTAEPPEAVGMSKWDTAFIGENNDLDSRSKAACSYARANANRVLTLNFMPSHNEIRLDNVSILFGRLRIELKGVNRLLVEATTLSVPEILYILAAATKENIRYIRLVYVEPTDYRRQIEGRLCDYRNFNLSDNRRFQSIPMFRTNLNELSVSRAIFFLGYEGARLGQALEQEEMLQKWRKHLVFGVPAFEPGWEIDSMANNVQYLNDNYQVQYAAASSASAAYQLLCELREEDKEDNPIVVAPLGTKPHAIGAMLFLIEHNSMDQAALLYDHPSRSKGRTENIRRWHFFDVTDNQL